jgi:hypothetical protein
MSLVLLAVAGANAVRALGNADGKRLESELGYGQREVSREFTDYNRNFDI